MTQRLTLLAVVALASSLLGCAHKPRRELDCRERIDDCMDDCSHDPKLQDSCYAGCRNISCDPSAAPEQREQEETR
jgi:hypothetical protein